MLYAAQTDSVDYPDSGYGSSGSYSGGGYYGGLWYQDRIGHLPKGGEDVDVFILDTGIRFDHKEFGNRAKYGGYDPVDSYYDTVPLHGEDCVGHGTAVASLVGGKVFGAAKKANLYSVRVIPCDRAAPWDLIMTGLSYVGKSVIKSRHNSIVVLALSGILSWSINDMIRWLSEWNVMVVTASGNSGADACQFSPASSVALTVGATDMYDNISPTSNYGPCVDLFAPGEDILAAGHECDVCTNMMAGSTVSAAITAGVAAVYLSHFPRLPSALMKETILDMSDSGKVNLSSLAMQLQTPNLLLSGMYSSTML